MTCSRLNTTCSPSMFVSIVTNKHFARFFSQEDGLDVCGTLKDRRKPVQPIMWALVWPPQHCWGKGS